MWTALVVAHVKRHKYALDSFSAIFLKNRAPVKSTPVILNGGLLRDDLWVKVVGPVHYKVG